MTGQEWLALAIVGIVAGLQVRAWIGAGRRAGKPGGASCGGCSGCPSRRPGAGGPGSTLTPASHGACH